MPVALHTTVYKDLCFVLAQELHPNITISILKAYKDLNTKFDNQQLYFRLQKACVELPSGFEVTSFLADWRHKLFFLGSRQGALACFYISFETELIDSSFEAKLIGVWRRIHDHESVRSIQLHGKNNSKVYTEILTTGRNGAYQIIRIIFSEHLYDALRSALPLDTDTVDGSLKGIEMQYVHRSNLNRGWIEGVWFRQLQKIIRSPPLSTPTSFSGVLIPRSLAFGMKLLVN